MGAGAAATAAALVVVVGWEGKDEILSVLFSLIERNCWVAAGQACRGPVMLDPRHRALAVVKIGI